MSTETVIKLKHVLKMNSGVMTTTDVAYIEQAIGEVEAMLEMLRNVNRFGDVWFDGDVDNIDELSKILGL